MGCGNAKMNEFQAAMGLCNLHHLDREIGKRKKVVERYLSGLAGVPGISCHLQRRLTPNYAYFPVLFEGLRLTGTRYTTAWQGTEYTRENILSPD